MQHLYHRLCIGITKNVITVQFLRNGKLVWFMDSMCTKCFACELDIA